jgi:ATP-dependent protease ClpP protease subunit
VSPPGGGVGRADRRQASAVVLLALSSACCAAIVRTAVPGNAMACVHDPDGMINGPATEPLKVYEVQEVEGTIQVRA